MAQSSTQHVAIERYWSASKRYARNHCKYSFKELRTTVPNALDQVSVVEIRRYHRKSARFLSLYSSIDCSPALIEFLADQPFKSHRRVSKNDLVRFMSELKGTEKLTPKQKVMLEEMEAAMKTDASNEYNYNVMHTSHRVPIHLPCL